MKQTKTILSSLLLLGALTACVGGKNEPTVQTTDTVDSSAVEASVSDTLVFETVEFYDSIPVSGTDPQDRPTTVYCYNTLNSIRAVGGDPKAMEFVNQWLMLDAAGEFDKKAVNAEQLNDVYKKLAKFKVTDMESAFQHSSKEFFDQQKQDLDDVGLMNGSSEEDNITIVMNTKQVLTLRNTGDMYFSGAAHGMPWDFNTTFDLKNLRVLSLDDIITPQGKKPVLKMIYDDLMEQGYGEEISSPSSVVYPANHPSLTPEGVCFNYGSYEITSYAGGLPEVIIPYGKIEKYLTDEVKSLIK